jgi:hypothetical protein
MKVRGILMVDEQHYKARLVKVGDKEFWIPRSITSTITKFLPDANGHRECEMEVEGWFCEKNGL